MNHVDITKEPQRIISLCPGIGGIERALHRVIPDLRTVAYVEIEAFINQNLVWAMEKGVVAPAPIWTNVKTFDARPFRGKVHGITGGYPCQPFSNAGNRKGEDDPRHLWPFIRETIRAGEFIWCFFENVAGHLTMGYDSVYKDLRALGYDVEAGLYTAAEVGAPHQRERLFILAIKRGYTLSVGLADTNGNRHGGQHKGRFQPEIIGSSELAYSGNSGCGYGSDNREERCVQENFGTSEENKPERTGRISGVEQVGADNELADTNGSRGEQDRQQSELWTGCSEQPSGNSGDANKGENAEGRCDRWPARPGQAQYDWEEPRTVKPKVGSTVNGYNFREDFLRALGNAVVEQEAELAFIDLINKHNNK